MEEPLNLALGQFSAHTGEAPCNDPDLQCILNHLRMPPHFIVVESTTGFRQKQCQPRFLTTRVHERFDLSRAKLKLGSAPFKKHAKTALFGTEPLPDACVILDGTVEIKAQFTFETGSLAEAGKHSILPGLLLCASMVALLRRRSQNVNAEALVLKNICN